MLSTSADLKTNACTAAGRPHRLIRDIMQRIPAAVSDKFYGCGAPLPLGIKGMWPAALTSTHGRQAVSGGMPLSCCTPTVHACAICMLQLTCSFLPFCPALRKPLLAMSPLRLPAGLRVLDLGSGSGRDCYVCAALVGEQGSVIGVDMTQEQIQVKQMQPAELFCCHHCYPCGLKICKAGTGRFSDLSWRQWWPSTGPCCSLHWWNQKPSACALRMLCS